MSDTPVVPLPPSYDWGFVVGRSISAMADTVADPDRFPEARGSNGRVTFTPHTRYKRETSSPTAFVQFEVVTAKIVNGNVVDAQGQDGIYLISGAYKVAFTIDSGSIPGFDILVTPDYTLENPLDLVTAAPFVPEPDTPVTTAILPVGASEGQVIGWRNGRLVWVSNSVQDGIAEARAYVDSRTDALRPARNLWNPDQVMDGYTISGSQSSMGEPIASSAYQLSGFIPVEVGKPYTLWGESFDDQVRGPRSWGFYDIARQPIVIDHDSDMASQTLIAPQDGFLRASFRKEIVGAPMIEASPTATTYEPYEVEITGLVLSADSLPSGGVTPEKTSFASLGKNLLDPDEFVQDHLLNSGDGSTVPLAGYTVSGFFPVTAGTSYTGVLRVWAFYTSSGAFISGTNTGSNTEVATVVAPNGAALMRASWASSRDSIQQIEEGPAATEFEPYGIRIPALITTGDSASTGPVKVTATESGSAQIHSRVGSKLFTIDIDLQGSRNGTFNFVSAMLDGTVLSTADDDIAPVRTFNTVGANHGYTCITALSVPGHGKTTADLGSVWTDGAKQWTLLLIDGDKLTVGPEYSVNAEGVATAPSSAPVATLTHVSGATSTANIPVDTLASGGQLYPSVQRTHVTLLVDGQPVGEGEHYGVTAQIRESYEVLNYASIIDTAQANIGTPFHEVRVAGSVRVENVYTFKPGLTLVDTALTELAPTILGSCGFVQGIYPRGTGGRIVPGVTGWITPKPLSDTWESEIVTIADLIDPTVPPVMSLDVMDWGGFALGYFPHSGGVTASAERIDNGGSRLWDLRATKKSYPSPWASKSAGWGRVEAHSYRAYLTPEQTAEVTAVVEDAHAAHSALASVTGL